MRPFNDTVCVSRDVKRVLFVPYALHDRDGYTKTARDKFKTLGIYILKINFMHYLGFLIFMNILLMVFVYF